MNIRSYPLPMNDDARAAAVSAAAETGARSAAFFQSVSHMAQAILKVPVAYTSLLERDRQIMLEPVGVDLREVPRDMALCSFTIMQKDVLVIPDALLDARFAVNPAVKDPPHVRFYAGAPVILTNGLTMGTVCGVGFEPMDDLTQDQKAALAGLADIVARYLEEPMMPDPEQAARLEDAARRAQDEFLALVSHELRTPLNGIVGLLEIIEPKDDDEVEILAALRASSEHLHGIIDNILHFTELSNGTAEVSEVEMPVASLVQKMREEFRPLLRTLGKTFELAGDGLDRTLVIDPAKMQVALACLIANAVFHGGNRICFTVSATDAADLIFEVEDNGSGLPVDVASRVVDQFAVGAPVQTRTADGLGLGLPLTRKLVDLHGGAFTYGNGPGSFWCRLTLPAYRVR